MRNQKPATELAYKSAKCNTLRQCGVITDPPHNIHTQHSVFCVAHKDIIVRTSKISSCLSHIFLILTGVSRGGRKITTTRKHLTISFGARRNRYKTDKIAFFNLKNFHFSSNWRLSNVSTRCLFTFCGSSLRNRKLIARMSLLNRRFCIRQIVSRVQWLEVLQNYKSFRKWYFFKT